MTGPDRSRLELVVPGPDYPVRPRRDFRVIGVAVVVIAVLAIVAAASRGPAEHSSPSPSPAEPADGVSEWAAQPALGAPQPYPSVLAADLVPSDQAAAPRYRGTATGEASWYDDGPGLYGAVHSWRFGDDPYWVEVCREDASATCVLVVVRDHMANDDRAIDLSPDAFVRLWPGLGRRVALERGVVDVTVRDTGASVTLPPTEVLP